MKGFSFSFSSFRERRVHPFVIVDEELYRYGCVGVPLTEEIRLKIVGSPGWTVFCVHSFE